jgi:hypothetical protein
MEEPGQSSAKSLIGKALLLRNATVPKKNHCTFRFWRMTVFERILRLGLDNSFYNIKLLQFLSFYQLIDSENKVSPS